MPKYDQGPLEEIDKENTWTFSLPFLYYTQSTSTSFG